MRRRNIRHSGGGALMWEQPRLDADLIEWPTGERAWIDAAYLAYDAPRYGYGDKVWMEGRAELATIIRDASGAHTRKSFFAVGIASDFGDRLDILDDLGIVHDLVWGEFSDDHGDFAGHLVVVEDEDALLKARLALF